MNFQRARLRTRPRRRRPRTSRLAISLVAASLALGACGAPDSDSQSGGSQALNVGRAALLDTLDPHRTNGAEVSCQILCSVYDRLTELGPDGAVAPGVAESWEYSSDALTLTFALRDDVTFSDGTQLDASAVKASLDRARAMTDAPGASDLVSIKDIEVLNTFTVALHLKQPDSALPGLLYGVSGSIVNPKAIENGTDLATETAGSGPFELASFAQDSEVKLQQREGYWGEAPALTELNFKFITDPAALTSALASGQLDVAQVDPANLAAFDGNDQFVLEDVPSLSYVNIPINWQSTGLTDVRARQALLYAIDREAICEEVQQGYCAITDQPFPAGYATNDDTIDQVLYPYDPDKARQLLADAGIDHLSMTSMQWEESLMPVMQSVQEYWKAVGIEVDLQVVDANTMVDKVFTSKTVDMAPNTTSGQAEPARRFSCCYLDPAFVNPGPATTPELKDLYDRALKATDPNERAELLTAASREVAETAQAIVLYGIRPVYVMKKRVEKEFDLSQPIPRFDDASLS